MKSRNIARGLAALLLTDWFLQMDIRTVNYPSSIYIASHSLLLSFRPFLFLPTVSQFISSLDLLKTAWICRRASIKPVFPTLYPTSDHRTRSPLPFNTQHLLRSTVYTIHLNITRQSHILIAFRVWSTYIEIRTKSSSRMYNT